jgi:hypothetical protein
MLAPAGSGNMIPAMPPSPFAQRLHEAGVLSRSDPAGACDRCEDLLAQAATAGEVVQLATFATQVATATLGQPARAVALLDRCLAHAAVAADIDAARSLHRALAVVAELRGDLATAAHERIFGITSPADECRLASAAAHLFVACNRAGEALPHLRRAAALVRDLPAGDAAAAQVAAVAGNLVRLAELQARSAHELLDAAAAAHLAANGRHEDWRQRHGAWHQYGMALLLSGQPTKALAAVGRMIELEHQHAAGPAQRFLSANLACRAQAMRGQFRVAALAENACRSYAEAAMREGAVPGDLGPALDDLGRFVAGLQTT